MDLPEKTKSNLINIEIHISDILVIDDRDFSITYSLYFNVQWQEPRLKINENFFQQNEYVATQKYILKEYLPPTTLIC